MKNGLKRIITKDDKGNMSKIVTNQEEMECKIIEYNRNHYKKAFSTPIYYD